jgi:hypothetical protein
MEAAPLSGVATGLVAAPRAGEAEVAPGKGIMFGLYMSPLTNWISDKPAGYYGANVPIPWGEAFNFSRALDISVVLRSPPRSAATLAAGDTFMFFCLSIESFSGQDAGLSDIDTVDMFDSMDLYGFWLGGRTVLDPLGPRSSVRPYLQYGGGLVGYPSVGRTDAAAATSNWVPSWVLGWRMAVGLEMRRGKVGAYLDAGLQSVGAPKVDSAASSVANQAQDLVTYPMRIGFMLSF